MVKLIQESAKYGLKYKINSITDKSNVTIRVNDTNYIVSLSDLIIWAGSNQQYRSLPIKDYKSPQEEI